MNPISYKTLSTNPQTAEKAWVLVDAEQQVLGRLASEVAKMIRGKHKPSYTPHVDCGDNVIIINADKIKLTGNKWKDKTYVSHTGYPGGQKTKSPQELKEKKMTFIIEHAVKGMLPKSRLGRQLFTNLFVYEGAHHPHQAQKPTTVTLNEK